MAKPKMRKIKTTTQYFFFSFIDERMCLFLMLSYFENQNLVVKRWDMDFRLRFKNQ